MIETAQGDSQAIAVATLELRRASPDDRELLAGMYRTFEPKAAAQGLPPRHDPERWLAGLSVYPNFLAIVGGRLAGHSVLCSDGETAEIAVFVHQDFRGRGLGKRLLAEMVHEARRLGLRRVWGVTDLDNVPMLRLARALGFVPGRDPREFYLNLHAESHVAAT